MNPGTSRSIYNAFRSMSSEIRSSTQMELDIKCIDGNQEEYETNLSDQEQELNRQILQGAMDQNDEGDDDEIDDDEEQYNPYNPSDNRLYSYDDPTLNIKTTEKNDDEIMYEKGIKELESQGLVDISNLASWEVSSCKSGFDCAKMREDSPNAYWQSDGGQPHSILIKFAKSVNIKCLSLFLNYIVDESYTPEHIVILAGTGEHDLLEVLQKHFIEPVGWQNIEFDELCPDSLLHCYLIKIKFISNHQNGKDCHVRGIKIFSPMLKMNDSNNTLNDDCIGFTSMKLICESTIR